MRGLKDGANVFDELVFDVNSTYFEERGGYEYAQKFFEETYRLAVKEIGGEQYILSAIMHADERNKALSEQLGRDVYHYHLHVVYVPVVTKEARIDRLDEQITVKEKAKATIAEVDAMGHSLPVIPGVHLTDVEAKKLKSLAKKGVGVDKRAEDYKQKITTLEGNIRDLNSDIASLQQSVRSITRDRDTWKANYERLWAEVRDFSQAIRRMPEKLRGFIHEHLPKSHNQEVSH